MGYKLQKEVAGGKVVDVSLGVPEVDGYLKVIKHRCRANTCMCYGYDLQVFLNFIRKPLTGVTPADILAFVESQRSSPNQRAAACQARRSSGDSLTPDSSSVQ